MRGMSANECLFHYRLAFLTYLVIFQVCYMVLQ